MWKNWIHDLFHQENLYVQALRRSHRMLEMDWTMYEASVRSLRRSDSADIDIDIFAMDKEINAFEREVRRMVLTHLAISRGDLTAGLILSSVVIDIERIGDYTKNVYLLAVHHLNRLHGGPLEERLCEIEREVTTCFRDMIPAFRDNDEKRSRELMTLYKTDLAPRCDDFVHGLVGGSVDGLTTQQAATLALYVRYLKRIASHSRSIVTSVVNPFDRIGYKEKTD